jgi:hypothetical protein
MGMAAFRVNDEERRALEAEAAEQVAECPMPTADEPEPKKTTTVTAKKPAATAKG